MIRSKKTITKEQVGYIVKKYKIKLGIFLILENGFIDVKGSVKIEGNNIFKLPLKFNTVTGDFYCKAIGLNTLKGSPKFVGGSFNCADNNLSSLVGGPKYVGGSYFCQENNLVNLKGCPIEIVGRFNCALNNLKSLKYGPKRVGKSYYANHNNLISLSGSPFYIGGSFHAEANSLNNLTYCPDYIMGTLHLDIWIPSLYMGIKNCSVKKVKLEKLEKLKDHHQMLDALMINSQKAIPILFKYNKHLEIWNADGSINHNNLDEMLLEIKEGML